MRQSEVEVIRFRAKRLEKDAEIENLTCISLTRYTGKHSSELVMQ